MQPACAVEPVHLRCEDQITPLAVDTPAPRLSWELRAQRRGARQVAWQIQVASSLHRLRQGQADLWDSGKVFSSEQSQIPYRGAVLTSHTECYWRVRVWDETEQPSTWSAPARWVQGLMRPEDFQAHWITAPPLHPAPLEGCQWIWHPGGYPSEAPPVGRLRFQKEFALAQTAYPLEATFLLATSGSASVTLNGKQLAQFSGGPTVHFIDLLETLEPGINTLVVTVEHPQAGPAGWTGRITLTLEPGARIEIPVNRTWRCVLETGAAVQGRPHDSTSWTNALELGPFGMQPWGRDFTGQEPLPLFRREFTVRRTPHRALLHICGLGHHELLLNGRKVGDHFLDPPWTDPEKTLHYVTHDLTDRIRVGRNAIGVLLGKGFYNTAGDRRIHGVHTRAPLRLWAQLHLFYPDGSQETLITDERWKTAPGPITHCAILGGEDHDARREPPGWSRPGFDDRSWAPARLADPPAGRLRAAYAPPLREQELFRPIRIDEPQPGIFVYDFGQNISAIPRIRVRGVAGQILRLTPAEQRHGSSPRRNDGRGRIDQAGVGRPNYWQYTLRGDWYETWKPRFTYSGYQYLEVRGAVPRGFTNPANLPVIDELVSIHVRNDAPRIGRFECSDDLINAIDRIIDRAVQSNLSHVLTDCPHREKLGWLEVPYLMGPSIAGRYDIAAFYRKVARDCADAQQRDGLVPTVAPWYPRFGGPFDYTPEWGAAAVILPWQLYEWYGDRWILEELFDTMRRFTDFLERTSSNLVPRAGLGDWYDYGEVTRGPSQFTPPELTAMATFYRCARTVAAAAEVLQKPAEQRHYLHLAQQIRTAFNREWFDGHAHYRNFGSPQCAHAMALALDLVQDEHKTAVLQALLDDLHKRGYQQTAGDIGHAYLLDALARHHQHRVIASMVTRTNLGSYGFFVQNGWTTLPEAWDAETGASMNHCMLGHVQQWFLHHLAGLRPDPLHPGGSRWLIEPQPVGTVTWARAEHRSPRGWLRIHWQQSPRRFVLNLEIPPNVTAEVSLPGPFSESVTESGRPATQSPGVRPLPSVRDRVRFELPSGVYQFQSFPSPGRRP
ncbi:MAG: family 78 glycoside hydrolase catalytic domain [Verrucomicrobiota bacterium]|nr:family 78 glycoside hydrolase catalytic domain [Verrucomicrobiota bacterium]